MKRLTLISMALLFSIISFGQYHIPEEMHKYPHEPQNEEVIATLEGQISHDFHIRFTTNISHSYWGLNSNGKRDFAPSDEAYILFLNDFINHANAQDLQTIYVPYGDNILDVSVIVHDYKNYSNPHNADIDYRSESSCAEFDQEYDSPWGKRRRICRDFFRAYVRDNSAAKLVKDIKSKPNIFPEAGTTEAHHVFKRRMALLSAIKEIGDQVAAQNFDIGYIMNFDQATQSQKMPSLKRLNQLVSYFDQDHILHGFINVLDDLNNGKRPGDGYTVWLLKEGFMNRISWLVGRTIGGFIVDASPSYIVDSSHSVQERAEELIRKHWNN